MRITINGNEKELTAPIALGELVGQYCANTKHVIAEVNGEIIGAAQWTDRPIKEGDSIELVSFVGGG